MTETRASRRIRPAGRSITFTPPEDDARRAHPFWRADSCAAVISILPAAARHDIQRAVPLRCRVLHRRGIDGLHHILLVEDGRSLQLVLHPGARLTTGILPVRIGLAPQALAAQWLAVRRLADFVATGRLRPALYPPPSSPQRLLTVLRALDGHLAGASFREIARALYGDSVVAEEWGADRRPIYFQVRRAVRRGLFLMRGGYRRLLR
jgi:hypothetical protein